MNKIEQINFVFLGTVLISLFSGFLPISELLSNRSAQLIVSQIILIIPAVAYMILSKKNYFQLINLKKIKLGTIALIILFTFLVMPFMTLINAISMLFAVNTTTMTISLITSKESFFLSFLSIAFLPAVFEESVYRGLILGEYRKVRPIAGILLSAFLFGILHGNFNQFSYAFMMGMVFALIIEATDSILSSMIMHFIINFNSVALLYYYPKLLELIGVGSEEIEEISSAAMNVLNSETLGSVLATYGFPALICSILAFFVYRMIAINSGRWDKIKGYFVKFKRKDEIITPMQVQVKLLTWPLLIAIFICVANMVAYEFLVRKFL